MALIGGALHSEKLETDLVIDGGPAFMRKWVPTGAKPTKIPGFTYRSSGIYKTIDGIEHKLVSYLKKSPKWTPKYTPPTILTAESRLPPIPEYNWQ